MRTVHAEGEFLVPEAPYTLCGVAYADVPETEWIHQDMDYVTCTECTYTDFLMSGGGWEPEPSYHPFRDEEEKWYYTSPERIGIPGYTGY